MRLFVKIVSLLPLWFLYLLVDVLFFPIVYHLVRYRRRTVRNNLRNSFPDYSWMQIKTIERKHYRSFCDLVVEVIYGYGASRAEMARRAKFTHIKEYAEISKQYGGSIIMLGHLGNWEWLTEVGNEVAPYGVKSMHVYRKLRNEKMNDLMTEIRLKHGSELVEKKQVLRQMVAQRKLETPFAYGFIADQKPSPSVTHYYWTNFLNQNTPFLDGAEQLATRFHYPVFYAYIRRPHRGYYEIDMQLLTDKPQTLAPYTITEYFARRLEQNILEQPHIWLWTHNRWKYTYSEEKDVLKIIHKTNKETDKE